MNDKIDDYVIRRVKEAAKIQEVVSECGVKLVKKGQRYAGICPFHGDQAMGNFFVYPRMNVFKCFRCEAKGDSVKFVMEHEGLSFPDAIRWLGKMYNIETDGKELNYTPPPRPTPPPPKLLLTLPMRLVTAREHTESDAFCYWVRNGIRWDTAQRQRVESVLQAYHVGHTSVRHYDFTMFWQIDEQDQVRTAHIGRYCLTFACLLYTRQISGS